MIEQFCPNPVVLQRLSTGPLRAHINAAANSYRNRVYEFERSSPCACSLTSAWLLRQSPDSSGLQLTARQ